jgi:hypothetical protein
MASTRRTRKGRALSLRYVITSHRHLTGVRLSRLGDWGNLPFGNESAARAHAKADASGRAFTIERKHFTRTLPEVL